MITNVHSLQDNIILLLQFKFQIDMCKGFPVPSPPDFKNAVSRKTNLSLN